MPNLGQYSPEEKNALREALEGHSKLLKENLKRPDLFESPNHWPLATQLRVLLCDADTPILLSYAKATGRQLRIWGPTPVPERLQKHIAIELNFEIASVAPFYGATQYDLAQFLDIPIGFSPVRAFHLENPGEAYSARKIIKWVANKEGFAHLDFKKPKAFESLKNVTTHSDHYTIEDSQTKLILKQIGECVAYYADELL